SCCSLGAVYYLFTAYTERAFLQSVRLFKHPLKDLHIFAQYYVRLLNPEREKNHKVRKYFNRLNRLEVATVYPFILNCYDDWMQARITEDEFIYVLQIIENFILRRFVCNIQTRGLNRIFALLYSQVSKDTSLASDNFVGRFKLALQSRDYPKDVEFRARLMDVKLYGGNRSEKAKLILESIEESFKHKEQVSFDGLSIEHVMPQTLNEWWKEHLGENWAVTHELLRHSLGNLTLTAYNSELSNDEFTSKCIHFQNSHLELNKYFQNRESWQREDIEARAAYLAERALQIWNYFGNELAQLSQPSILTGTIPKRLHLFGQEHSVKSWRDVLEITMNFLADLEPERFQDIMQQFPRFVGLDEKDFRHTRKLHNGAFIEVNLSAKDIDAFCRKAIETAELSIEEWQIEILNSP
ncbi:MAG: HNH endonuclease family protein, partial [Nostoc sp.]|uniref:HNH endonuclease family protein n=1 Tax=Nostoc sp. TaxID=1180 RepID=UPI002FF7049E